jgi:cytochrome c biogenesis protein
VTVVEMAGLGRSESAKLPEELGDLAALVHDRAPTKTDDGSTKTDDDPKTPNSDADTHDSDSGVEPPVPAEGAEK